MRKVSRNAYFIAIIIAVILIDTYYWFESEETTENSTRTLATDGFCCFMSTGLNVKSREEERSKTLAYLPSDY